MRGWVKLTLASRLQKTTSQNWSYKAPFVSFTYMIWKELIQKVIFIHWTPLCSVPKFWAFAWHSQNKDVPPWVELSIQYAIIICYNYRYLRAYRDEVTDGWCGEWNIIFTKDDASDITKLLSTFIHIEFIHFIVSEECECGIYYFEFILLNSDLTQCKQ